MKVMREYGPNVEVKATHIVVKMQALRGDDCKYDIHGFMRVLATNGLIKRVRIGRGASYELTKYGAVCQINKTSKEETHDFAEKLREFTMGDLTKIAHETTAQSVIKELSEAGKIIRIKKSRLPVIWRWAEWPLKDKQ